MYPLQFHRGLSFFHSCFQLLVSEPFCCPDTNCGKRQSVWKGEGVVGWELCQQIISLCSCQKIKGEEVESCRKWQTSFLDRSSGWYTGRWWQFLALSLAPLGSQATQSRSWWWTLSKSETFVRCMLKNYGWKQLFCAKSKYWATKSGSEKNLPSCLVCVNCLNWVKAVHRCCACLKN